jgi:hypothetical protein
MKKIEVKIRVKKLDKNFIRMLRKNNDNNKEKLFYLLKKKLLQILNFISWYSLQGSNNNSIVFS